MNIPQNINGQTTSANSSPVVISNDSTVDVAGNDVILTGSITAADIVSTSRVGQGGQNLFSGVPTAGSAVSLAFPIINSFPESFSNAVISIIGTFVGTYVFERSPDLGTTWTAVSFFIAGTRDATNTGTLEGMFHGNVAGTTNMRVRCTSFTSGTINVRITSGIGTGTITVGNPLRIYDAINKVEGTIKLSTAATVSTDTALVVGLSPNSPTPNFLSPQAVTGTFFQATQPVSLATNTPDVIDRATRQLGIASIKGLAIVPQSTAFAAATVGATVGFDVTAAANITFIVKNTVAATAWTGSPVIVFEQSDDNVSWALMGVVRNDTGLSASTHTLPVGTANTEYMFDTASEGPSFTRARVTTGTTTGGITIVVQPGSMPFTPSATAILNPETTKVIGTVINAPSTNVIGRVGIDQTTLGNTNAVQLIPGTTNGLTSFQLVSAATTNATVLKASAGQVYGWYIYNSNAAARKLVFHNTAAAPTAGAAVFLSLMIPPGSGANVHMSTGIQFSTGIAITTTTGIANTDAVAVALNDLIINIFYK